MKAIELTRFKAHEFNVRVEDLSGRKSESSHNF